MYVTALFITFVQFLERLTSLTSVQSGITAISQASSANLRTLIWHKNYMPASLNSANDRAAFLNARSYSIENNKISLSVCLYFDFGNVI